MDGREQSYFEAGCLNSLADPTTSEFRVLTLDPIGRRLSVVDYRWNEERDHYASSKYDDVPLSPNDQSNGLGLSLGASFMKHLNDVGVELMHSRKPELSLQDVFVFPVLRRDKTEGGGSDLTFNGGDFFLVAASCQSQKPCHRSHLLCGQLQPVLEL